MKKNAISLGVAVLSLCFASFAQAQSPTPTRAQTHKEALAYCQTLSGEAKTNCRRDAFASYNDSNRNQKTPDMQTLKQNRMARCQALPAHLREDCIAQMSDQYDTKVYGSVEGGGVLRQTTIEIPGQPRQAATPAPVYPSPSTPTTTPMKY